jgi:hypothetical protein
MGTLKNAPTCPCASLNAERHVVGDDARRLRKRRPDLLRVIAVESAPISEKEPALISIKAFVWRPAAT